jgi:DNA invertase Pin-like site-specific DNA recombinase
LPCPRTGAATSPPRLKNGLDAARRAGRIGGRPTVVDDDKRAAIHARRARGESIRTIATGLAISIGVVHKTLTETTSSSPVES